MRARHGAYRAMIFQIREGDEFRDIDLIGAPRFRIGDVGEPFELGRYIREIAVLVRCECFDRHDMLICVYILPACADNMRSAATAADPLPFSRPP